MEFGNYTITDTGLVRVPTPAAETGSVDTSWINTLPLNVLTDDLLAVIRNNPRHFHHDKVPKCYTKRMALLVECLVTLNKDLTLPLLPIPFNIPEYEPRPLWDPFDDNLHESEYVAKGSDPFEVDWVDFDL
jgi:hypothetical protein